MQTERSQNNVSTPDTIPEVVYEGSKICNLQLRYAIKLFFATDRTKLLYSWVKQNVIQMGQFKDALDYLIFLDGRNINLWEKN